MYEIPVKLGIFKYKTMRSKELIFLTFKLLEFSKSFIKTSNYCASFAGEVSL
jgi:hypothetical protein